MHDVKPNDLIAQLSLKLVQHYDEFSAFDEDCAFLCDAFSCLVANSEIMDQRSMSGLERQAESLKKQSSELKSSLKTIRALYLSIPCEPR